MRHFLLRKNSTVIHKILEQQIVEHVSSKFNEKTIREMIFSVNIAQEKNN